MNTTDAILSELLTGAETTDARIREAFLLGIRHGAAADRQGIRRSAQLETTRHLIAILMRAQHLDLETAMVTLQIPRSDRKTLVKLFSTKERQRQARAK